MRPKVPKHERFAPTGISLHPKQKQYVFQTCAVLRVGHSKYFQWLVDYDQKRGIARKIAARVTAEAERKLARA